MKAEVLTTKYSNNLHQDEVQGSIHNKTLNIFTYILKNTIPLKRVFKYLTIHKMVISKSIVQIFFKSNFHKLFFLDIVSIIIFKLYRVVQKKNSWCDVEEECSRNSKIFLCGVFISIFTSYAAKLIILWPQLQFLT